MPDKFEQFFVRYVWIYLVCMHVVVFLHRTDIDSSVVLLPRCFGRFWSLIYEKLLFWCFQTYTDAVIKGLLVIWEPPVDIETQKIHPHIRCVQFEDDIDKFNRDVSEPLCETSNTKCSGNLCRRPLRFLQRFLCLYVIMFGNNSVKM